MLLNPLNIYFISVFIIKYREWYKEQLDGLYNLDL